MPTLRVPKILTDQTFPNVDAAIVITDKNSDTHTLNVDSNGEYSTAFPAAGSIDEIDVVESIRFLLEVSYCRYESDDGHRPS